MLPFSTARPRISCLAPAVASVATRNLAISPPSSCSSMAPRRKAVVPAATTKSGAPTGDGSRLAEQLLDNAEECVEQLEQKAGAKAEAHLGPAPSTEGEEATVWYFAFGSNINKKVFQGRRMISPAESVPAVLPGWRLEFSQPGLPYAEPAFAAVERRQEGSDDDGACPLDVHGVAHRITPSQWAYVLETEGGSGGKEDHAYQVVEATAEAYDGRALGVVTLSVSPRVKARLQGRRALPSLRYLNLIRDGARDYGLTPEYQAWLASLQPYEAKAPGQKLGSLAFKLIAFTTVFPVWASMRLLRRVVGMQSASNDTASRLMQRYTARMFQLVLGLHEVVRPVLGCGMSNGDAPR